jgi:DNA-binding NarL/FixJ family response regulator
MSPVRYDPEVIFCFKSSYRALYHREILDLMAYPYDHIIYLPGQNGGQVLREFKALDDRVRVLMASGFFSPQEATSLKKEGAWGLIYKPYRLTELENRIQAVLAGRSGF